MSTSEEILAGLNDRQREAVLATRGPVLIIAGAGSGKTSALTRRIAYLIKSAGVSPRQILAVTFTNKAAKEMRERVQKLLGVAVNSPEVPMLGTFHSVCVQILRREIHHLGRENRFVIYDDTDQLAVMRQIFDELKLDAKEYNPKAVLGSISWAKSHLIGPEGYVADSDFTAKVSQAYPLYQKKLLENNGIDFDDLILLTVQLFREHADILDRYQERWPYLCVDEYQDTNHAQAVLINLLAEKYRNLCVVGDPDQSIYSWRGADVSNILDFRRKYPEATEVKLEQNYRSTQVILDAANAAIRKNKSRQEKTLWTDKSGGDKICIMQLGDERLEAEWVVQEIMRLTRAGTPYSKCVILYRTNAQSRILEEVLLRHGIPHRIIGGVKFYARKEVKDVLAYLRLTQNPSDNLALLRVVNTPARKLGPKTLEVLQQIATAKGLPLLAAIDHVAETVIPATKQEILRQFAELIRSFTRLNQTESAAGMIKNILAKTRLKEYWDQEGTIEGQTRYENVLELISVASKYDLLEPGVSLATFLEEVALLTDADRAEEQDSSVTLMTLHSAKGLEFPVVFLVGLEQNIFPSSRTLLEPRQLEEERRLFYVGLTRAEERLYLTHARQRFFFGETQVNAPSQFLDDLPSETLLAESQTELRRRGWGDTVLPDENSPAPVCFAAGDAVRHPVFGQGLVVAVRGGVIEVNFGGSVGVKKLAISIAPIEKV